MKIKFLGAAGNVTGSKFLAETRGSRILVDCGLYQERNLQDRNWENLAVSPASIKNVLLTHGHLDHCGYLPKLVKEGFNGNIFCTLPTQEIAQIVLLDAARIQEEDAVTKKTRHHNENRRGPHPEIPLYTVEDAKKVFPLFKTIPYEEQIRVSPDAKAIFHDVGHILGAATIELEIDDGKRKKTVIFSGDIGRWDRPLLNDPVIPGKADCVLMESTYGDRRHEEPNVAVERLRKIIVETQNAGGNVVVPTFATERAQDLLYYLSGLMRNGRIPAVPVFIDSPMAIDITEIFKKSVYYLDEETKELIRKGASPFSFPLLNIARTAEESKAINFKKGTSVILSGSGMCTGGRVKHHLKHNINRTESTVLFVGYQAPGTLGRELLNGAGNVRIFGENYPVRAKIESIEGFSGHADRNELLRWISGFKKTPEKILVIHGEKETAIRFADTLRGNLKNSVSVPEYLQEVELPAGEPVQSGTTGINFQKDRN